MARNGSAWRSWRVNEHGVHLTHLTWIMWIMWRFGGGWPFQHAGCKSLRLGWRWREAGQVPIARAKYNSERSNAAWPSPEPATFKRDDDTEEAETEKLIKSRSKCQRYAANGCIKMTRGPFIILLGRSTVTGWLNDCIIAMVTQTTAPQLTNKSTRKKNK